MPALLAGVTMLILGATGDSRFYVRSAMRLPLVIAGAVALFVGVRSALAAPEGHPHRIPRSAGFVVLPFVLLVLTPPGPLGVDSAVPVAGPQRGQTPPKVVIPPSALVGANAPDSVVEANATSLGVDQFQFAVVELGDNFRGIAVRMIGQIRISKHADTPPQLVRFKIVCCAADAIRVSVLLDGRHVPAQGTWVEVTGQWDGDTANPGLRVVAIRTIDQPANPYL
ncbi:MAG: hypothetical protein QM733_17525 [Ilumatobacteraceae bacterium]